MPKGDAELLRADIDDGHTRVANLLLEGLCCAPLSGAQYAVALFIIRRTYGWAKQKDRASGKLDAMTAEEIADGTALSRGGVHKALQALGAANIIIQEQVRPGNYMAYGMNPDVGSWGLTNREWRTCKQALRDAREGYRYNRGGVEVSPVRGGGLTEKGQRSDPEISEGHGAKPTGTGLQGTSTAVRQKGLQKGGQGTAPPAPAEQGTSTANAPAAAVVAAAHDFYGTATPPGGWKRYEQNLREGLQIAGDRLSPGTVIAAYHSDGDERPQPGEYADAFLKRLLRDHDGDEEQEQAKINRRGQLVRQIADAIDAGDDALAATLREEFVAL